MSRLRLKSFKLLKAPQANPPAQILKKSVSTHLSIGKSQQHPPLKSKHCRSRGFLTRRQTDRSSITKDISKRSHSRSVGLAEAQGGHLQKSRSPSYNEIKKKRLMRDRKSRDRLVKGKDLQPIKPLPDGLHREEIVIPNQSQLKMILKNKGLESESKIKGYIKQLENVLCVLQDKHQKTEQRRPPEPAIQSSSIIVPSLPLPNSNTNLTDRKIAQHRPCNDPSKNTLRMYAQPSPSSAETSRHELVQQIIKKAKKQRKLVNLKQVREKYKELSPAKQAFLTQRVQSEKKVIREYQEVPEKENQCLNRYNQTIPEESELTKTKRQAMEDISVSVQLKAQCSQIKRKQRDSFFSDVPSILKDQPKEQPQNSKLLQLLQVDSLNLKKVFRSKQKRRLVQKWKKNFPEGFFQDIQLF